MSSSPGAVLASTVTAAAALGFVPVAVYFHFFELLNRIGPVATASALTKASDEERTEEEKEVAPLCQRLTEDTMLAMAGLGLVDLVDDTTFRANAITKHMVAVPSSIHGMLHFTTEPLWAAAFLMRKLQATKFEYPFRDKETPMQYGYKLIGEDRFVNEHTYSIMAMQGRMPSFNLFMEGKFGSFGTMPERVKRLGYDLDAALLRHDDNNNNNNNNDDDDDSQIAVVDIGGGRGEMLLEVKRAYPHLTKQSLILQDYHPEMVNAEEVTVMHWDFKDDQSPQEIRGALVYSLTHIYHNLSDLEALRLMKKVAAAMGPQSRMLIHEFSKNSTYGKMHATMIELYAGRLRSSREWKQMAELVGLQVTFEVYPPAGEGLIEMRKPPSA